MKKKLLITIASGMAALSLAGCSLADIRDDGSGTDNTDTVDTTVIDNSVPEPVDTNQGEDTPDTVNTPTETINYEGAYAVFKEGYDTIYIIDSYDRMITSYDRTKLGSITSLQDENLETAVFVGFNDGIYYFLNKNVTDLEDYTTLYAVDWATNEAVVVCHYAQDETVSAVDIYDDKIYVTFFSAGSRENKYYEDVYIKKEGSFEYDVEEGSQNSFLSKNKVDRIYTNSINSAFHEYCSYSIERSIAECGYVIAEASGKYEKVNSGGSIQVLDIPYSGITICGYDSKYVVMTAYNEEYYGRYIYCYDTISDSYYTVGNADAAFLGYVDGYLYYSEEEGEEYGHINNHVYKFDPTNGMVQELYDLYNTPGVPEVDAGVTGFCYIKDHVMFLQCVGGKIGWMAVYYDEAGATYKNLDCVIAEVNAWKYGSVSYASIMEDCPFCNNRLMNYYTEVFQVDESVAKGYEKINGFLNALELSNYDEYISDQYTVTDASKCDEHNHLGTYCYTINRVADANVLSDKYLTVTYEVESYTGGVNVAYYSKQYIFDIESGGEMTVADFYTGTEDEFKDFIATKTVEDYQVNPDNYYISSKGEVGIYESAYGQAGFDVVNLEFGEDMIYLVYREYSMGPGASGPIRIAITYQELLGRNRL